MLLRDTWQLTLRRLRYSWRMPVWVVATLSQPLIWLLLFGQLFQNMVRIPGFPTDSYIQFFSPGVLVMTALFGSAWSGMGILNDYQSGVVDKYLVTPVSRVAIILGPVLDAAVTVIVQTLIILGVALLVGAHVAAGVGGAIAAVAVAALLGAAFAALSNGLAVLLQRDEPMIAILNFLLLPLTFLSTAMLPSFLIPGWIAGVARFNPVNWAVEATRSLIVGGWTWGLIGRDLALLAAFAALLVLLATGAFRARRA